MQPQDEMEEDKHRQQTIRSKVSHNAPQFQMGGEMTNLENILSFINTFWLFNVFMLSVVST